MSGGDSVGLLIHPQVDSGLPALQAARKFLKERGLQVWEVRREGRLLWPCVLISRIPESDFAGAGGLSDCARCHHVGVMTRKAGPLVERGVRQQFERLLNAMRTQLGLKKEDLS